MGSADLSRSIGGVDFGTVMSGKIVNRNNKIKKDDTPSDNSYSLLNPTLYSFGASDSLGDSGFSGGGGDFGGGGADGSF